MFYVLLLIFIVLIMSLVLSLYQRGKFAVWLRLFRILAVVGSISCFAYWFVERSLSQFLENSMAVQVVNHLPQPMDFYLIKITYNEDPKQKYISQHLGTIRPDFYRVEYLKMQKSNEFWIAGYIGKSRMVYFSQHSVLNKTEDKLIEVKSYINQSLKLSAIAEDRISILKYDNVRMSVWVTLDMLLIFLNLVILIKRKPRF